MYLYLIYEFKDVIVKNKYKYSKYDIVVLNNFDIDCYIMFDVEDKDDMLNDVCDLIDDYNLVNMCELRCFLKVYGLEYGMFGIKVVNLVLCVYIGLIRLYFDVVYQECKYGRGDINKEIGEI